MKLNETFDNLIFDFDSCSLSTITVGQSVPDLESSFKLENQKLGYTVYTKQNFVTGFFICFTMNYRGFNVFQGKCKKSGQVIKLSSSCTPNQIIALFGAPKSHWNDGVDESCTYEYDNYDLEFTWDVENGNQRLYYVIVDLNYELQKKILKD